MQTIKLETPLEVIIQPEVRKTIDEIIIQRIVDFNQEKRILAFLSNIDKPLVLWKDEEYTAIGDWTQVQAEEKIIELLRN